MNRLIRRTVTTALLVAVFVVWVQLITASGDGLLHRADQGRPRCRGGRCSAWHCAFAVAARGCGWLGLVDALEALSRARASGTGALFVLVAAPNSAGSAFVYGLLSSIISLVVLAALAVHARLDQVSRKRDETAQALPGPGPHTA